MRKYTILSAFLTVVILFAIIEEVRALDIRLIDPADAYEADIDVVSYGIRELREKIETWITVRGSICTRPPVNAYVEYAFVGLSVRKDQPKYLFKCTLKFVTKEVYENGSLIHKTETYASLQTESSYTKLQASDYSVEVNTIKFYIEKDLNAIKAGITQVAVSAIKNSENSVHFDHAVYNFEGGSTSPPPDGNNAHLFFYDVVLYIIFIGIVCIAVVVVVYLLVRRKRYYT